MIEIQDQKYEEKTNTVTITVVCCNPEKLMEKIRCEGCRFIKTIEIKLPTPSPTPKKTPPPPPTPPKTPPPTPPKPDPMATIRFEFCCTECSCGPNGRHCHSCKPPPPPPPRPCHCRPFCDGCVCGCGRGCGCGCGGSYRYCHVSHGGCSFEEDPRGCSIM
ncbi:hypothetical protein PTKIN_Ptkin16aG0542700 [Pterospermum kingtungense]